MMRHRKPRIHTGTGFGGYFQDTHARPDLLNVAMGRIPIELRSRGQVDLCDNCHIGGIKDRWILQGLIRGRSWTGTLDFRHSR
jgi:hypothetical protein